jgi:hypothetical protein
VKDAGERQKTEAQEATEWKKGANNRGAARADSAAEKADEALRKKKEKEAMLEAEEEESGNIKVKKSVGAGMNAKKAKGKKGKQDDFSLLEDSLVSAADKKSKAAKKTAQLKKERAAKEALAKKPQSTTNDNEDPLLTNTEDMLRGAAAYVDDSGEVVVGSKANKAMGSGDVVGSGLNAALGQISVGASQNDIHPEKRSKALHMAFQERMMPEMKSDYPGLKKSQYQERIFKLWQKSPENPMNWPKAETSSSKK